MTDNLSESRRLAADAAKEALITVAIRAWEDAGLSGLCAEGRWEAAIGAIRAWDAAAATVRSDADPAV